MLASAFVAIGYYSQPSFELGYALKFMRIMLLLLIQFFNVWGLVIGVVLTAICIGCNKTITEDSFLYPIIPFKWCEFKKMFYRTKNV